jgi:dipeptidase
MWGAEMGVNEFGRAAGNEAVFTREPLVRDKGLTGMDLVRLTLERARNSRQGIETLATLLETHGQGGNCGFSRPFFYHNSFLLADPDSAWVLETAGRHWAAMEIHGAYAISNCLTLDTRWDLASPDLVGNAVRNGWCRSESDFSFSRCYSHPLYTRLARGSLRRARAVELLEGGGGTLRPSDLAGLLRDHGRDPEGDFRPGSGLLPSGICSHAGFGPVLAASQTTASLICHLSHDAPVHYATGTSAPCTGIFKPVWADIPLPAGLHPPSGTWDSRSLFWAHERIHRLTLRSYDTLLPLYSRRRDILESRFMEQAATARRADAPERASVAGACWEESLGEEERWLEQVRRAAGKNRSGTFHAMTWKSLNRKAGIEPQLS